MVTIPATSNGCMQTVPGTCQEQLHKLYHAYLSIVSGTNVVAVQSSDFRKVEYGPGNMDELKRAYAALWDCCGSDSGLPSRLGVQRGGPIYGGC